MPVGARASVSSWCLSCEVQDNVWGPRWYTFIIDPYIRFKGQKGEQATLFIVDPSLNGIELKSFKEKEMIFFS